MTGLHVAGMILALAFGVVVGVMLDYSPPPAAVPAGRVVRMLDVTIRDKNTTNRRQRFVCTPVERSR